MKKNNIKIASLLILQGLITTVFAQQENNLDKCAKKLAALKPENMSPLYKDSNEAKEALVKLIKLGHVNTAEVLCETVDVVLTQDDIATAKIHVSRKQPFRHAVNAVSPSSQTPRKGSDKQERQKDY